MRTLGSLFVWLLVSGFIRDAGAAAPLEEMDFRSSDGLCIKADFYPGTRHDRLTVLAPGFAQNKATLSMKELAGGLASLGDVLVVDFRGTGRSGGAFCFGSKEYRDLEPALSWARSRYPEVDLLGFSLGAYSSLRAAVLWPGLMDRVLLVSCPTKIEDIVLSGAPLYHPFAMFFHREKLKLPHQADPFFRWGPIFSPKPSATRLARRLEVPVYFLVSGSDSLVFEAQSREVYEAVPGFKRWERWPQDLHAEAMFLMDPRAFLRWVKDSEEG
jgi:pimeloyl-ACP methyl ester carboxylesterase